MSDAPENDSKTEVPTEKRLRDSLDKGQAPVSRDAATLAIFVAMWIVLLWLVWSSSVHVAGIGLRLLEHAGRLRLESGADAAALLAAVALEGSRAVALPLAVIGGLGLTAFIVQSRRFLVLSRVAPDPSRLSLAKGFLRLAGPMALKEFFKSLVKLSALGAVGWVVVASRWQDLIVLIEFDAQDIGIRLVALCVSLIAGCIAVAVVFTAIDVALVFFDWMKSIRMTKQEVRDEVKEGEGDPVLIARRRAIARARIRQRLAADVPRATVVIANPTHYAVALRYVEAENAAPLVVAKGADQLALTIRAIAQERGIPIVENVELARALYAQVPVEHQIPVAFYRVVADLMILLRRKRSSMPM